MTETKNPLTALYEKMAAEQEQYRQWLLGQPPDEILNHASEYSIREIIVEMAKDDDFPLAQITTLLKSKAPLAEVFKQWKNHQDGYLEGIRAAFERSAEVISYDQRQRMGREVR